MYWFYKDKRFRVDPDKCACGGTPKIEFDFKFDPYRWRVYCPECGETTDTHYERTEAIFAWNRRGGKKMSINTKCAQCGGTAHMKFNVLAEPWDKHYVAICEDCGECGEPSHSFAKALNDWERRQKENMTGKKKREYIVVATRKEDVGAELFLCGTDSLLAVQRAKDLLNSPDIDKVFMAQIIGVSKTVRQMIYTGEDEC